MPPRLRKRVKIEIPAYKTLLEETKAHIAAESVLSEEQLKFIIENVLMRAVKNQIDESVRTNANGELPRRFHCSVNTILTEFELYSKPLRFISDPMIDQVLKAFRDHAPVEWTIEFQPENNRRFIIKKGLPPPDECVVV